MLFFVRQSLRLTTSVTLTPWPRIPKAMGALYIGPMAKSSGRVRFSSPPLSLRYLATRALPGEKDGLVKDEKIYSPTIELIDVDGNLIGIQSLADVLQKMDRTQFTVVRVDKSCKPPKCRMMRKKDLFDKLKKKKKASSGLRQQGGTPRELLVGSNITEHDLGHKLNRVEHLLNKGRQVRVIIVRKTQRGKPDRSRPLANEIIAHLTSVGKLHGSIVVEGKNTTFLLMPH
ncbi:hypothetical protein IWQ61_005547 [Dispira simplex]|nr:hypothetical protein IWQ61_005547 [Dispira simplex]